MLEDEIATEHKSLKGAKYFPMSPVSCSKEIPLVIVSQQNTVRNLFPEGEVNKKGVSTRTWLKTKSLMFQKHSLSEDLARFLMVFKNLDTGNIIYKYLT